MRRNTSKVYDTKGGMDGTKKALENALSDDDPVKRITIETPWGMDDTQIRVQMTNKSGEDRPAVPKAICDQLDEWGFKLDGETGTSTVYRTEKTIAKYES